MEVRQIINMASRPSKPSSNFAPLCSALTLPSNGVITLNASTTIILQGDALYQPLCNDSNDVIISGPGAASQIHFRDPFFASTLPECYALAATTVIAYMLVIILLITPQKFLHDGVLVLGTSSFTNGPSGSNSGFGIGGRPWLQKAAALTVAISLTIATANTFKVAEKQYNAGYMDALELQKKVEDGTELKIIRIISDTFLWLAQAQTLIRLFPRHREKVIIKWTAFALITLDELFSILNAFAYKGSTRPRSFVDAVPALTYLFQLALSLLYAAWVMYYSTTKKAFAFYHPQMKNICLVAVLSLISVLVPVVFFVTDISKPDLARWGDYVRWVGAAAASVVVWEWVERIEALERNDKKDGILGREVFDGDEMLDVNSSTNFTQDERLPRAKKIFFRRWRDFRDSSLDSKWIRGPFFSGAVSGYKRREKSDIEFGKNMSQSKHKINHSHIWPIKHPPAALSFNTTNTGSAKSTVYTVNYHSVSGEIPSAADTSRNPNSTQSTNIEGLGQSSLQEDNQAHENSLAEEQTDDNDDSTSPQRYNPLRPFTRANILKNKGSKPPPEVSAHKNEHGDLRRLQINFPRWEMRARFDDFITSKASKLHDKKPQSSNVNTNILPKTIIPAPPRRTNLSATFHELEEVGRSAFSSSHR